MKIRHYITIDKGAGPVSFVEITTDAATSMLRITHNARFDKVREVDPVGTREAIDGSSDLGTVSTRVDPSFSERLGQEVLRWASAKGCQNQALRWPDNADAIQFRHEADAIAWDAGHRQVEAPKRRRMILG